MRTTITSDGASCARSALGWIGILAIVWSMEQQQLVRLDFDVDHLTHKKLHAFTPFDASLSLAQLQAGLSERAGSQLGWHWQYSEAHFVSNVVPLNKGCTSLFTMHFVIEVGQRDSRSGLIFFSHSPCCILSVRCVNALHYVWLCRRSKGNKGYVVKRHAG